MHALSERWLEDLVGPTTLARPVLLLCRTDATVHSAQVWAARRGGALGLDIATPRMLANQLVGPPIDPEPDDGPLPSHPFLDRIRDRAGLLEIARQHARELRLARVAASVDAPGWLTQVADSPWRDDTGPERRLLELARRHGRKLTPSVRFHRVVALGFDATTTPWEQALLDALGAERPVDDGQRCRPTHAWAVPDPVAAARVAASLATERPLDTLILVQHPATAARVHRTLVRNGLPSGLRRPIRLDRHTLATVIRRCGEWFSGPEDPLIRAGDLYDVLRHPMVGNRLPEPARLWLEDRVGERTQLRPRELARVVRRARHLRAPLSAWIREVDALGHRDDLNIQDAAWRTCARLRMLQACIQGQAFASVFEIDGPEDDPDWEDFDALIAQFVDEQDVPQDESIPTPGTVGCLRRFLHAAGVQTRDDPAALHILAALRRGRERPATRTDLLQLLAGTAERSDLTAGVQVLTYEAYDGRPCDRLVLLDVHDQGIAARSRPDPLLSDAALEALGVPDRRRQVEHRLDQLLRACANARDSTAILSHTDTMGRAVVAPIQLDLRPLPKPAGAYGLAQELPERTRRHALSPTVPEPPAHDDALAQHLAIQASAEWFRAGVGAAEPPAHPGVPGAETLTHRLYTEPMPASWMAPWLGDSRHAPEARLAASPQSASGFFKPLTHCLYQAFVKRQLRIEPPEEVGEELDPREIGNAVHDALEVVAERGGFAATGAPDALRDSLVEALRSSTAHAFERARDDFGALSPARRAAALGLESRWANHWQLYVDKRVFRAADQVDAQLAGKVLWQHPALDLAVKALEHSGQLEERPPVPQKHLRYWVADAARDIVYHDRQPEIPKKLPSAWADTLRRFRDHPRFRTLLDVYDGLLRLTNATTNAVVATAAEVPFGDVSGGPSELRNDQGTVPFDIGELELQLGSERQAVRGRIDRIDVIPHKLGPLAKIVDYKTGRTAPSQVQGLRQLLRLVEPQLVVYALVLQQAIAEGKVPDQLRDATVATVGWDHPRAVANERDLQEARDGYPLDRATLDLLARAIGSLVGRARQGHWPLHPNPDTCPELNSFGHDYCPYAGACRFRSHG